MSFLRRHAPQRAIMLAVVVLAALLLVFHLADWPTAQNAVTRADDVVILSATVALASLAAILNGLRYRTGVRLGAIKARALFRLVCRRLAPPAVAATLTVAHTGHGGVGVAVFAAMVLGTALFGGTHYPFHLSGVARFVFDLFMPVLGISAVLLAAWLWGVSLNAEALAVPLVGAWFVTFAGGWLEEAFNRERPVRLAVIGGPLLAHTFALDMQVTGVRDYRVAGWVSGAEPAGDGAIGPESRVTSGWDDLEWLGCVEDLRSIVVANEIDVLVMTRRGAPPDVFNEVVEHCVDLPVRMVQASHLFEEMHGRVPIDAINSEWFAYIMHPNFAARVTWRKRLMDIAVAAVLLVVLAPLFALLAIAVKLCDGGPVLFRQRRVGAHGHDFNVLKFRTMVVDAEPLGEPRWALANDGRVTAVGRVLRKRHIDEMPQLINVLVGDMSLVGPRPERPEFVAQLETKIPYYSRRVLVKPGITGWAQVRSGYAGSEVGAAFKLSHDLYYIKHRSLVFDVLAMVETARILFTPSEHFEFGDAEPAGLAGTVDHREAVAALADNVRRTDVAEEARLAQSASAIVRFHLEETTLRLRGRDVPMVSAVLGEECNVRANPMLAAEQGHDDAGDTVGTTPRGPSPGA
jgi:exopolysaccharide biosynthesis polyprenyl glycosylphosphotransferase